MSWTYTATSVVGGGKRFFPDGVRLDPELVDERVFDSGLTYALPNPLSSLQHRDSRCRAADK